MNSIPFINKWSRLALVLVALFTSVISSADESYTNIFIFGDSLSDTGNLASVRGDFPNPPFFNNRVTNGLVAVDTIAASLNLNADASLYLLGLAAGGNYAVAGARSAGESPIDLTAQVTAFLASYNANAPKDALYVVLIGGNDVFDAAKIPDIIAAKQRIDAGVMTEKQQIQALINAGAENFLVINVVDVSITPRINAAVLQIPTVRDYANSLVIHYNDTLEASLEDIKHDNDIEIEQFDLYQAFNDLLQDAQDLGFTNTTDACFSTATLTFNDGCNFGANFPNYVFFDEIHPTTRAHKIIADQIVEELD
ncbi:Phospholipase/lecithinase/hemolysin [hydrothermal vent metagenome]|uniref:Phospholipase/lecithinase/hemolysin n=1 Tax=hydrothermal vent metagenome TaxID=652676 RepID=A0A3B0ZMD0_9ZZZZ